MVSVHSTYNHPDHPHNHNFHVKKRRKEPRIDQKIDYPDVKNRTSWASASLARSLIREGKASGNETSLWIRAKLQAELFKLGSKIQRHAGKILLIGVLILGSLAFFNKNAHFETRVEKLWVEAGGRLEKELKYVEASLGIGAGATNELIIQTPNQGFSSILTPDALLTHLEVLKTASKVMVERNDVTWQLKDLCYAPTIPKTETYVIDQILEKLFPCAIITPLDCFWEGAKLLGPDYPVHIPLGEGEGSMPVSWTTLNPQHLVQQMKSFNFQFDAFEDFMKTAGIKSGYQEKPCLNPHDPDCPPTAPNKESRKVPDIGAELTGGCYGFASRYMHWPEQLVVGGTIKNKTGHITRAKGLQSSIQLMGEKDLYDFWSNTHKVHYGMEWNREVASSILSEWQAKFSQEVATLVKEKQMHKKYQINAFSSSYLNDILATFSEYDVFSLSLSYLFVLIYAGLTLFNWNDVVKSQAGLGLSGVLLVTLTVAGGLGCCALIDIPFNAITTQVIPVWVVCMGINPIFIMTQTYTEICNSNIPMEHKIGEVVKRTGISVLYPAICITAAFVSAALIPIPAIRGPMLSGGLLIGFNGLSMLLLFPALLSLDLKRRSAERLDVLCCYNPKVQKDQKGQNKWTLKTFVIHYQKWLVTKPMKIATLMLAFILTSCGLYGLAHMQQGLDMQEVVPQNTSAYEFVKAQNSYFGFYNMYAVTKGNFEYPQNQAILYDYHNAFVRVPNIIKDDDGGLEEFWLPLFRNWLLRLQNAFDDDFSQGNIYEYGWHQNASSDAILAYKLLVQTGHVDYPIDETLLLRNRLVDSHGMINPSAFYNYLSAWASNDAMTYGFSQVSIVPEPKHWHHDSRDAGLIIPKSMPITFARIPFHLYNLGSTSVMLQMIEDVRNVCNRFEDRGLPNFPTGVPFTFWEQYINLPFWLLVAFGAVLAAVFLLTSFLLWSFWVGVITVVVIGSIVVQLYGVMEFLGVTLSAVPAVITILAVGLGVEFTMHIIMGFITSIGNRNRRLMISLEHMFAPVFHGAVSTFLGIIMLAFSHFDFVVRYFFMVFTGLILLGVFNGLVFLPVLLLMVGPPAEVVPKDGGDEVDLSTTEVTRGCPNRRSSMRSNPLQNAKIPPPPNNLQNLKINAGSLPKRHCHHSDASLSTIAEESGSYVSQHDNASINALPLTSQSLNGASVKIEPEITVETTTHPLGNSLSSSRCSTPTAQVTKVTANLAFKVEVHAPHVSSPQVAEPPTRPVSSASRRSSRSSSRSSKTSEAPSTGDRSVHSSLSDSLRSSLSSSSGQDFDNNGDAGFSEK